MGKHRIMKTTARLCLLIVAIGLVACNQPPEITDKDIQILDDIGLVELLEQQQSILIVDVRPDYRYRAGHLPNAINIPLPDLSPDDPRFVDIEHIVVYADGRRNTLSQAAAKKLLASGQLVVSDFRGGFEIWQRNNRKIVTSQ
jgi:rhodanese-related sulfurtransferase